MSQDIRWLQRFENLQKATERFNEAIEAIGQSPDNHLYQIALIGAYQFTFELSWKTLKDFLKYKGVDASLPRDVIKQAFHHGLIENGELWIEMLDTRNLMAHVYQEAKAKEAVSHIQQSYQFALKQVFDFLNHQSRNG